MGSKYNYFIISSYFKNKQIIVFRYCKSNFKLLSVLVSIFRVLNR